MSKAKTLNPSLSGMMVLAFDMLLAAAIMATSMILRYILEDKAPPENMVLTATLVFAASVAAVWIVMRLYRAMWRFTSLIDLQRLLLGTIFAGMLTPLVMFVFFDRADGFPRSIPFIAGGAYFIALVLTRGAATALDSGEFRAVFRRADPNKPTAILIGENAVLSDYLRERRKGSGGMPFRVVGLVDPSGEHTGRTISGVKIIGSPDALPREVETLRRRHGTAPLLVAVGPFKDKSQASALVRMASDLGLPLSKLQPDHGQSLSAFEAADLIGRHVNLPETGSVGDFIQGKRILITGAGGTIGSELTRQIAGFNPDAMCLVDSSELNIYEIDQDLLSLRAEDGSGVWRVYLGDVRDRTRMDEIFKKFKPEIILHAAALKHVPLMEYNPIEALQTNVGGARNIIEMAVKHGADTLTLISTDKAVTPVNIMGATKRLSEMLCIAAAQNSPNLSVSAVRFGNVLGSNGSVIPFFEKQIKNGGPVTVTHKDVTRYFMTVSEAAALVLQASALHVEQEETRAAVYVLDMGDPVNITHLAKQLIRLRGLVPGKDIEIEYIGLRPGEKLTERLVGQSENLEPTSVAGIARFTGDIQDGDQVLEEIEKLLSACKTRERKKIIKALKTLLPNFVPNGGLS